MSFRSAWVSSIVGIVVLAPASLPAQTEAESLSASFRKAARRVLPAVVTVRSTGVPLPIEPGPGLGPFVAIDAGPASPRNLGGSGVVIDAAKGLVLTNDHVVADGSPIVVTLPDGRERAARSIRRDPKSDLALVSIDPAGLHQADWGDSEALDTGDWVLAIGQPFGLSDTVTAGIISGKGRGIGAAIYEDLIQTDAAINPGNSGGPLVNMKGEVIGINSAIKTVNGGSEGVGFAVPATRARRVAADLAEFGRVRRSQIGIRIGRLDPATAERLAQRPGAVLVSAVTVGGPAARAGIQPGDLITALRGKPVGGSARLQSIIETAPSGEPLAVSILRGGETMEVEVRPEPQVDPLERFEPPPGRVPRPLDAPNPAGGREPELFPIPKADAPASAPGERMEGRSPSRFPELGLRLSEPTPTLVRRHALEDGAKGLVVIGVEPDGLADRGGLEIGMLITDVAHRKVSTLPEFRSALAKRREGTDLIMRIIKGGQAGFRVILVDAEKQKVAPPPVPEPAKSEEPCAVRP